MTYRLFAVKGNADKSGSGVHPHYRGELRNEKLLAIKAGGNAAAQCRSLIRSIRVHHGDVQGLSFIGVLLH